jgi:hypothetical protein
VSTSPSDISPTQECEAGASNGSIGRVPLVVGRRRASFK